MSKSEFIIMIVLIVISMSRFKLTIHTLSNVLMNVIFQFNYLSNTNSNQNVKKLVNFLFMNRDCHYWLIIEWPKHWSYK